MFQIGDCVNITGLTIGKGFTGNVKRHNFGRGAMTHGSKHHRAQGSLGSGTTPGRVFPGKKCLVILEWKKNCLRLRNY